MTQNRMEQLKTAEKGALVSIGAYLVIAVCKLAVGYIANSSALLADGLNNTTDIVASSAVYIGLRLARQPADDDHRYGHWKAESLASLLTSMIMLLVGGQVFISAIKNLFKSHTVSPGPLAAYTGLASAIIMFAVYWYNHKLAKQVNSHALEAAAKDNFSDALTSIGTAIAVFAASFDLIWLDKITAIIIGLIIIKTGLDIFKESSFSLSDGFSTEALTKYKEEVAKIEGVVSVKSLRARSYGANIFLDITVLMSPSMTVQESHNITEQIEQMLSKKFHVFDVDVHVEPAQANIPK
ncbi:cation diffusion facilitator family transporter [Vagococcus elongatus]|uniref:Transporter n=1 Tax=Vagococcus elongatus TaxID=180344 RepID=A0A430AN67_9ENTE|nr:cation diffusion facilitator family transporter [Vagococcus elongatus]RSU09562.1 transporter [Vagococcus elongatus]